MIGQKPRRAFAILVPITNAILFFGIVKAIDMNLINTGVTLGIVMGFLNLILWYMVWKKLIP